MKALLFERSVPRLAAARLAGSWRPGAGARAGALQLADIDPPDLPGPGWRRMTPRLSGICGSDLSTVDGRASHYFEPIVSFPFVPGHEVVGTLDDADRDDDGAGNDLPAGTRVVVEPVLGCSARGILPLCEGCSSGDTGNCRNVGFGHLRPGLQTGYCADTGGGWSTAMVVHDSQIHSVPDSFSDEDAVMVEPTACGVHAALAAGDVDDSTVVVLGAGTLGLTVVAALRRLSLPGHLVVGAKHPVQRRWARDLGADEVVDPQAVIRMVRRRSRSLANGRALTGGADVVVDCVGSGSSIEQSVAMTRPRGRVVLAGMPGTVHLDLTALWHKEIQLAGAYAYGTETPPSDPARAATRTFELAFDIVSDARLGRLVGARYPLERYAEAMTHAAEAGRRGTIKVAFDLTSGTRRPTWRTA